MKALHSVRFGHTAQIELDLAKVTFVDSDGLSVNVTAPHSVGDEDVRFVVAVPPVLRRAFDASGLAELVDLRA